MAKLGELAVEVELLLLESAVQQREKLPAKHSAQDAHGQKEPVTATHPTSTIGTDATTRDDAVQVRVG